MINKKIFIFILGIFLISCTSLTSAIISSTDPNLVNYYKFDESSGSLGRDNVSNNNLTHINSPTVIGSGKINNARCYVAGSSQHSASVINSSAAIYGANPWSISWWALNMTVGSGTWGKGTTSANNIIAMDSGVTQMSFNKWSSNPVFTSINTTMQWTHWVAMYNGSELLLYQNGTKLIGDANRVVTLNIGSNKVFEVGKTGDYAGYFTGCIDEMGIWNRTLSESEISTLFANGAGYTYPFTFTPDSISGKLNGLNNRAEGITNITLSSNSTLNGNSMNLTNVTYYLWDISSTLINKTTKIITGNGTNVTNNTISGLTSPMTYYWNTYTCAGNSSWSNCSWSDNGNYTFYTYMSLKMYANGNELTTDIINISCPSISLTTTSTSPYQTGITTFIPSGTSNNISCSFNDITGYYKATNSTINFTTNLQSYNVSLTGKGITLNFYNYTGNPINISGYWSDTNQTKNFFTNTTFIQILKDTVQGIVSIKFGFNISTYILNYSQFYEYNNDWVTEIKQNLTTITTDKTKWTTMYIKVTDAGSGDLIDNALVRALYSDPLQGGQYKVYGQRFTGISEGSGYTYFITDVDTQVKLLVTKEDYSAKEISFDAGIREYPITSPLEVKLSKNLTRTKDGIYIWAYNTFFNNRSKNFELGIFAPERDNGQITYSTDYRQILNYANKSITLNSLKMGTLTLESETDFNSGGTSDIILTIWENGNEWGEFTIKYKNLNQTKFNEPTDYDTTNPTEYKYWLWIGLLTISCIFGFIFKEAGEELSGAIGLQTFMIGGILLSFFSTGFLWLSLVNGLFYSMLILKRYINE